MNKGINTATRDFEKNVAEIVNSAGLPACIIRLVLEKTLSQVCGIEAGIITQEDIRASDCKESVKENDS